MAREIWRIFIFHIAKNRIIQYIINQEEHHAKKTFRREYLNLLKSFEIKFDDLYIFEFTIDI
jgi:putative transposase